MKRTRSIAFILGALLLAATVLSGCGAAMISSADRDAIARSETYCAQIDEIIQWQLDGTEEYRKQRDVYKETGDPRDEPEDDYEEVVVKYDEFKLISAELSTLKARVAERGSGNSKAEAALSRSANDYFAMLEAICGDMDAVFSYYFSMREAMEPIGEFSAAENTTGYADYALFAGQLSQVVSQSQTKLKKISCPPYMADSHKAYLDRIDEFQSFCQDFSIAVQLSDPLRLASCGYRMDRLTLMLDKCDDALNDDFNLQFARLSQRLQGSIAKLRGELLGYM